MSGEQAAVPSEAGRRFPVKITRDLFLFVLGVVLIVNEVWFVTELRPSVLIFAGALLGLPVFLRGAGA